MEQDDAGTHLAIPRLRGPLMGNPAPFKQLFDDYRDEIGRDLKLQMDVEHRDYRSLAAELGMSTTTLNAIALGTRSSLDGVRKFEYYMAVLHWMGKFPAREAGAPATLIDVMGVIGRLDVPRTTRLLMQSLLRSAWCNSDTKPDRELPALDPGHLTIEDAK